jgi:hypothetical protein
MHVDRVCTCVCDEQPICVAYSLLRERHGEGWGHTSTGRCACLQCSVWGVGCVECQVCPKGVRDDDEGTLSCFELILRPVGGAGDTLARASFCWQNRRWVQPPLFVTSSLKNLFFFLF